MGPSRSRSHGGRSDSRSHSGSLSLLPPLPRVLLLKLAVLFFMAHPGSAATFADPRAFLLHLRYPNRDLDVPRAFGAVQQQHQHQQQQQPGQRREQQHPLKPAQPPAAAVTKAGFDTLLGGALGGRTPLLFIASPGKPAAAGRPASSASRMRPLNVVIGSFVSELERSPQDPRRKLFKPMHQQPQPQPAVRLPVAQPQQVQQLQQVQMQPAMAAAMAAAGATTPGQQLPQPQPPQPQRGGFAIPLPAIPVGAPQQLIRKSAATLVDAYDGVLSFVGSRLVTTEQTLSRALGSVSALTAGGSASAVGSSLTGVESKGQGSSSSSSNGKVQQSLSSSMAPLSSSSSSTSAPRYDLVGFLDLDPFEKSKRYFKRNSSLSKMLL